MRRYVLDASAAVHFLQAGPGAAKVTELLAEALRQQSMLYISVINLGEAFYLVWQRTGEEEARRAVMRISRLPINIISVDLALALKAGEMKVRHKMAYADSIAAALTTIQSATLVTSDHDFDKLGKHFPVLWIAR